MFHVLPWIEYYKVLQLTMGQKAKPDFDASMGSFDDAECCDAVLRMHQAWSSDFILLMGWPKDNSPTLALQKINAIVQRNRLRIPERPRPTAWKMDFRGVTMKLSTKTHKAYQRPRETINHPPIVQNGQGLDVQMCHAARFILYLFSNEAHSFFI